MKTARQNFPTFLLRHGCLNVGQLAEAVRLQQREGIPLREALLKLGFVTPAEIARAVAESYGLAFVDLTEITIPPAVLELVPASVARECVVLPLACEERALTVAVSNPTDRDTIAKLQFILNRDVGIVLAAREQILEAIDRYYGQTETESVDSMLCEFTDTQIDFSSSEVAASAADTTEFELGCVEEAGAAEALEEEACSLCEVGPEELRQATVRYYHRMNPEKMFPLLVVLSPKGILEIVQAGVSQSSSRRFKVELNSLIEVEPILPGCTCYPPREPLRVHPGEAQAAFWVVPHVLGKVMQARVVLRQQGEVLAEVPLEMRVGKQTLTLVMAALTCLLPMLAAVLQHFGIDLRERLQDGLYSRLTGVLLGSFSPDVLALLLLGVTCGLYLWLRPRRRDLFWDVVPVGAEGQPDPGEETHHSTDAKTRVDTAQAETQSSLLARARQVYRQERYEEALSLYRSALARGKAPAAAYAWAALAAGRLNKNALALRILRQATEQLPAAEITGGMWYNMGCFAARMGVATEAVRYLGRAVDAGYTDLNKFRTDPDLDRIRHTRDFKTLLACLDL